MSKRTTNTSQNQEWTAQHGWEAPPINAQMQEVINAANDERSAIDPSVQQRYATAEQQVIRSTNDPMGPATSPDVRQKMLTSRILGIHSERDKAMREGYFQGKQAMFGKKLAAAGLTMPQLVQRGGTSQGQAQTKQGSNFWASLTGKG